MNKVACGILIKDNKILMTKRSKKKREFPNYWEFPGGKCNKNESIQNCIKREINEELNIDINFIKIIKKMKIYNYNLSYCICHIINDNHIKKNNEIDEYRYVNVNDINRLKLLHGDNKLIDPIRKYIYDCCSTGLGK